MGGMNDLAAKVKRQGKNIDLKYEITAGLAMSPLQEDYFVLTNDLAGLVQVSGIVYSHLMEAIGEI